MSAWARAGARVELLTVLACDPGSSAPAGGWDSRAGHLTEGESARARREEDVRACAILGATPVWLPFGSVDYERHGTDDDVLEAVAAAVDGAAEALLPGVPLSHPDHAWLARLLAEAELGIGQRGVYAEQLYVRREGERLPPEYEPIDVGALDRLAKWRALRAYRSQLPLLGLTGPRRGAHTLLRREHVSWVR